MKKLIVFAAASFFCIQVMAQATKSEGKANATKETVKDPEATKATATQASQPVASTGNQVSPDDVIKVNVEKHDFGKIKQGVPVTYSFEIKNISKKPIVVENTYSTCGCTMPEKITDPIAPGATAKLKVQYNAAAMGSFTKVVHIKLAGIDQEKLVNIMGEVVAEPKGDEKPANNN